jgi:hypothetical protein
VLAGYLITTVLAAGKGNNRRNDGSPKKVDQYIRRYER